MQPQATVIFQLFDSRVYLASTEEGELTLPKRGEDGRFHVPGELVLADWAALKKIFTAALPLLRAGGKNRKLILSPLPRFVNSKCCASDLSDLHITNFGGKAYAKGMGKQLADIHGWLDDLARGRRLLNYESVCPSSAIGIDDNATIRDKATLEGLKNRWGADPVHLTPAGYNALADYLVTVCIKQADEKKESPGPARDTEKRRDGLSRSDWAASRWDNRAARSGHRSGAGGGRDRRAGDIEFSSGKRAKHF